MAKAGVLERWGRLEPFLLVGFPLLSMWAWQLTG